MDLKGFPGGPVIKNPPANAGDMGSSLGRSSKIPHAARPLSPGATTTEPGCCNYWSPLFVRAQAPQEAITMRSPHPAMKNKPSSLQLEKACTHISEDLAQPKQ